MLKIIKELKNIKMTKYIWAIILLIIAVSALCIYFVSVNESYYSKTIAKIFYVNAERKQQQDMDGNSEPIEQQHIKAVILNGTFKGREISLENMSSYSQVMDLNYKVGDEVFVTISNDGGKITGVQLIGFKRDKYILYTAIMFIFFITLIGGTKGFKSLLSVIINIFIFMAVIKLFLYGMNLTVISMAASLLFIGFSISIVCGVNKKTLSAVIGTMLSTFISMVIAAIVIKVNHWNGVHFEEMEFLTRPPEYIFLAEILIGTLGGIMDIAVSISSSISEICDKNPEIRIRQLIASAREIGQDIMGTMINTLVFAYISGSIPIILLLLRNGYPISYIVNINLSLELIRALTGGLGIILTIPITIYTSIIIFKKTRHWRKVEA